MKTSKKGNVVVRPKGLNRDQKPGKGPKPKGKPQTPNLPSGGVKPAPVKFKGKLVYQPK